MIGYTANIIFFHLSDTMNTSTQPVSSPADQAAPSTHSLDPIDAQSWADLRASGHQMLDDMLDYLQNIRQRPVWQPIPDALPQGFQQALPQQGQALDQVYQSFAEQVLPYSIGNVHPGFMGWVNGGGTPVGMLAEMLAGGLNANLGGRNHMPIVVEQQVVQWVRELFSFPDAATGLFVTGTSIANFIAVTVARTRALGQAVRQHGMREQRLCAYTSAGAHACVAQALDLSGLGIHALRQIPCNERFEMDLDLLRQTMAADRAAGWQPFLLVGTAGSVDVGAIDDLQALADIAQREQIWFHIDGAFGALGMMSPQIAPRLRGIERADSIAFDFHKWMQVPYDAGFILVRDGELHHDTFAQSTTYLRRDTRGAAAGTPWPCDFGPDLSRGFRALKTWMTIKTYGVERLGQVMSGTCELAQYLQGRVAACPELELMAPVNLNIVCFRYHPRQFGEAGLDLAALNAINAELIIQLHESGIALPSATTLNGQLVIRAALFNHRTQVQDVDALLAACLRLGKALQAGAWSIQGK
jgi:aromatic-L-amino-acid/L-tryptophan decarboxylase